jgi:hypothetical protein
VRVGEEPLDLGRFKGFLFSFLRRLFDCGGDLNGRLDPTSRDDYQHFKIKTYCLGWRLGRGVIGLSLVVGV